MTRASKCWSRAAQPWLYRTVMINLSPRDGIWTARLLKTLLDPGNGLCSRVRDLQIRMSPVDGHYRQQLPQNMSRALERLIHLASNLQVLKWGICESIPMDILKLLRQRQSQLTLVDASIMCYGSLEHAKSLMQIPTESLKTLTIEHQPRKVMDQPQPVESIESQDLFLRSLPGLETLTVRTIERSGVPALDIIHMDPTIRLPPIQRLHLSNYSFKLIVRGLQSNIDYVELKALVLENCQRPEVLFYCFGMGNPRCPQWHEFILRRPAWDAAAYDTELLWMVLRYQRSLRTLELDFVGQVIDMESSPQSLGYVIRRNRKTLENLRLHDVSDALRLHTSRSMPEETRQFKSIPILMLRKIRTWCPYLRSLCIDLVQSDAKVVRRRCLSSLLAVLCSAYPYSNSPSCV